MEANSLDLSARRSSVFLVNSSRVRVVSSIGLVYWQLSLLLLDVRSDLGEAVPSGELMLPHSGFLEESQSVSALE